MTNFEVRRNEDGSFALLNDKDEFIDGFRVQDDGHSRIQVWATARTAKGQEFYVKLPVTREMLALRPDIAEERLRDFAEHWARSHDGDIET